VIVKLVDERDKAPGLITGVHIHLRDAVNDDGVKVVAQGDVIGGAQRALAEVVEMEESHARLTTRHTQLATHQHRHHAAVGEVKARHRNRIRAIL
jgi:hypothetical protein